MKIGLFGGTFDPIHLGHVDMIRQVCNHIQLDEVIFIPAYIPPHKNNTITPFDHRLAMTELAIQHDSNFTISDFESTNPNPSYTYYTIMHFRQIYPDDDLYYIMGADSFNSIQSWFKWKELLCLANFIVIDRFKHPLHIEDSTKQVLLQSAYNVYHLPLNTIPISSTIIRQQLKAKNSVDDYIDKAVAKYIQSEQLYGE